MKQREAGSSLGGGSVRGASARRATRPPLERPTPLRERVYEAIAEMIVTRELKPGEHLVENELARDLGVSRQPVREALQRLQTEGWVDLRPGHGAFVHVPTDEEADQLLAVRAMLESESARLAAKYATAEHLEELRALLRAGEEAVAADDQADMVTANAALHAHVVSISGNRVLTNLIASVERRVRWYYLPIARSRGKDAWDEHAGIIDAIEEKNSRRAATQMRQHAERTRELYHEWREEVAAERA
ncbi:GntR family transcriptional regulator [uncultured Nocardioides sp.]|uniref:GntR family transcriptional regulator n=1 Tax=uncultured Nocardioides sp. TaxID=198441 RepID=UPI0025F5E39E|nr:GntR family transcriptional regulator [uncultured Nocardioides sp.]